MDSITPQYQTVPVADGYEKLLSSIQIPRSFTDEWRTLDPSSDNPTKRNSLISRMGPYLWVLDTALLLFIAGLLLVLGLRGGRREMQASS
ncbi:hypothetical protein F4782DRAFT_478956 [Xylaria castorea]|nr:hypothetical protein F4782DRAFT_478956 [Xylaria castorea]